MALFITVDDLQVIQKNVQADLLEPWLFVTQELYLKRILALNLYENLDSQIQLSGITGLTGIWSSLQVQVKPVMVYGAFFEGFPFLWAKITNKGIVTKSSTENDTTSVNDQQMLMLRANIKNYVDFYIEELKRFLRYNKAVYNWQEEYFQNYEQHSGATYTTGTFGYGNNFGIVFDRNTLNTDLMG